MSDVAFSSARQAAAGPRAAWPTDVLAVLLFLLLGIGVVLQPYATGRDMPGDIDARFNLSLLEFFYRTLVAALHGRPANFLDAPFWYPWPRVTNFSDTHWGDAEVYALFRALGVNVLASFQAWFVAGFALTYVAAFVSLRKLGLHSWGSAAGAFLFTFCLPMAAQLGHAQLVYRLWVPPAVVALHRFLTRASLRAAAACVLFVGLQLAVSIYLGLFLCLLLASYAASLWLLARAGFPPPLRAALRAARSADLVAAGALLAVALIALVIVAVPYLDVQSMYGFVRSWEEVVGMLPRPASYLLAGVSELWPDLSEQFALPSVWEHQIFPGFSAIIPLAWFGLSRRARTRQPLAAIMLAALAILFAVTIDLGGHTLYRLIYSLSGFSAIRAITRVILVMMLPLAALLGMMIDDLVAAGANRVPARLLAVALSAFVIAECVLIDPYSSSPSAWRTRLDALEARLPARLPHDAVFAIAVDPQDTEYNDTQTDAELVAATLGVSTMNGYSGSSPPTWKIMTTCRDVGDDLRAGRHFLAEHGQAAPAVDPSRLVLVGFGACDPAQFYREPSLQLGQVYHFTSEAEGNEFAGGGFAFPEGWGRWTNGDDAFLYFSLGTAPPAPLSVAIDAISMSSAADRAQIVTVVANGHACGEMVVTTSRPHAAITCPAGALGTEDNTLRLHIAHPTRPVDIGLSSDHRRLGLGLRTLTVTPIE